MGRLMIGISGVRGVVGDNLTPELLVRMGQAFGTWVDGGTVVVGRDTRVSGDMVKHAVFSGLLSAGCRIVDVGVCATPSAALMIRHLGANGGVVISASHNPIEWNALKFFREDGIYLNADQGRQFLDIYYGGDSLKVGHDKLHAVETNTETVEHHLERVVDIVDIKALRRKKLHVALDCCNGAGVELALKFFQRIGARVEEIHCTPNGLFPYDPEPSFEHVKDLARLVKKAGCDIGFAQDADADRIAIVSEKGTYIGEEYSLCLAAKHVLGHHPGPVVTNLSTTRMIEDVAGAFDCEVVRTPVGEVNVAEKMVAIDAAVGGEGNGGVIDPRVHMGRDALTGMAVMLQLMLETGLSVHELVAEIPRYHMVKKKVACHLRAVNPVLDTMSRETADRVDTRDGVKLDFPDSWVHVRPSNTEPIVRVYAEARTKAKAESLAAAYLKKVEDIVKKRGRP